MDDIRTGVLQGDWNLISLHNLCQKVIAHVPNKFLNNVSPFYNNILIESINVFMVHTLVRLSELHPAVYGHPAVMLTERNALL